MKEISRVNNCFVQSGSLLLNIFDRQFQHVNFKCAIRAMLSLLSCQRTRTISRSVDKDLSTQREFRQLETHLSQSLFFL